MTQNDRAVKGIPATGRSRRLDHFLPSSVDSVSPHAVYQTLSHVRRWPRSLTSVEIPRLPKLQTGLLRKQVFAVPMPFENDIFVSYAHVDNDPFDNPQGWVDSFAQRLGLRLAQVTGSKPAIWRDARLQGNEYFVGSIGDAVSSTRLLLSVISPVYVNSDWCRGELKEFSRRSIQSGGAGAGNLSRVFKVVKTHVDEGEMPEELQGLLGYHFYDFDERGRPREFRPDDPPNKDQRYWDRLEDLALDIVKALKTFGGREQREAQREAEPDADALPLEKKVYLAETTADVTPERDRIRREL